GDKMKKLVAMIASIIMVAIFVTGCGTTAQTTQKEIKLSSQLSALEKGMQDKGFIPDDDKSVTKTEMSPVKQEGTDGKTEEYGGYLIIGAVEGVRYSFKYNESDVNLEMYRFDTKKLDETGKKTISDVKSTGEMSIGEGDTKIKAYLSADEKYLLVYQDSSTEKKNQTKMNDAIKYFESYKEK
ncbi:MAG: hypothetical protein ACI4RL_04970, partial [Ruminococcus sp.]